jgi:hypothetical protein
MADDRIRASSSGGGDDDDGPRMACQLTNNAGCETFVLRSRRQICTLDFSANRSVTFNLDATCSCTLSPISSWTAALRFCRWTEDGSANSRIPPDIVLLDARNRIVMPVKEEYRMAWGEPFTLLRYTKPILRFTSQSTMTVLNLEKL